MEKKKTDKNKWIAAGLNIIPGVGYVYLQKNMPLAIGLLAIWPLSIIAAIEIPQLASPKSALQRQHIRPTLCSYLPRRPTT